MATNDLMTELQKDSIKLDDDSERKVYLFTCIWRLLINFDNVLEFSMFIIYMSNLKTINKTFSRNVILGSQLCGVLRNGLPGFGTEVIVKV